MVELESGGKEFHNGIDLKNPYGVPIYSMTDDIAKLKTQYDKKGNVSGAGYYAEISSIINGNTVEVRPLHIDINIWIL